MQQRKCRHPHRRAAGLATPMDQEGPGGQKPPVLSMGAQEKRDELSEAMRDVLRQCLEQCLEQGMQPPLILCVVSPNGSVMVMRTDGEHPEILTEHTEGAGFSTRINCMVVCSHYHRAKRCHHLSLGVWHAA